MGKTQVTIEYPQKADGSVEPQKIHTVVISTQHAEPGVALRSKEVEGYTGAEATAPSMARMNELIVSEVRKMLGRDHAQERETRCDPLRCAHQPAHQPVGEVHHRRPPG